MRVLSLVLIFLIPSFSLAQKIPSYIENKNKIELEVLKKIMENTTKDLFVEETIKDYKNVLIGNSSFGYEKYEVKNGKVSFFPITYTQEVKIISENGDVIKSKKYENKIPKYFYNKHRAKEEVNFSVKYMMLAGVESGGKNNQFNYIYLLNKSGEPIWFYIPKGVDFSRVNYISPKLRDGKIFLILRGKEALFQEINWKGEVKYQIKNTSFIPAKKFHHDFVFRDNNLLMLTQHKGFLRTSIFKKPKKIIYDRLLEINLEKKKSKEVWNSLNYFNPYKDFNEDFSHSNSLSINTKGEVLISVRNQSTLLKLDRNNKLIWSLGKEGEIKPETNRDIFRMQHNAQIVDQKTILLFDNHRTGEKNEKSRGLIISLDLKSKKYKILKSFYPEEELFSRNRSSFSQIKEGYISLFVLTNKDHDVIVEFDKNGKQVEAMKIKHHSKDSGAYRVLPIENLKGSSVW